MTKVGKEHERCLDEVAEQFVAELRAGNGPAVSDYCARFPELAADIESLFPALLRLEQVRLHETGERSPAAHHAHLEPLGPESPPLGDYRIVREIGRGGMGIVYEAIQESLERRVALKVLSPWMMRDVRQVQRFHREARAAARLHHSNIVPVLGVGEDQGIHYLVMQLIEGYALDELLEAIRVQQDPATGNHKSARRADSSVVRPPVARGASSLESVTNYVLGERVSMSRLATVEGSSATVAVTDAQAIRARADYWGRVAALGLQAAEALSYAAHQGVLHRDIKPSNLLIDSSGTLWIADFGLAKTDNSADLTASGEMVGTFRYMPPERLRGQSDVRGDVYGLGATLYELATLRPPFEVEDNAQLLKQIADTEPPRPRSLRREIPRDLDTIIVKAMAKHPRDRYSSPAELARDLRRFLHDQPIAARRVSAVERAWRWSRRYPMIAVPTACAAILALTVAVGALAAAARLSKENRIATDAQQRAVAAELGRRHELFRAHVLNARRAAAVGHASRRSAGLQALSEAREAIPQELRTPEENAELLDATIPCLTRADSHEIMRIGNLPYEAKSIDVTRDFDAYARPVAEGSGNAVISLTDPEKRVILAGDDSKQWSFNNRREFDDSGRLLGENVDRTRDEASRVRLWDRASGQLLLDISGKPSPMSTDVHPDGRQFLVGMTGDTYRVYEIPTGRVTKEFPTRLRGAGPSYSPDGSLVVSISPNAPAEVLETKTWKTIQTLTDVAGTTAVDWHPGSRSFVLGLIDGRLYRWWVDRNDGIFLTDGHDRGVDRIRISRDGRLLAATAAGITRIRRLDDDEVVLDLNGTLVQLSNDGRKLAVFDGDALIIHELDLAASYRRIQRPAETAVFSPDGQWLAVSGKSGVCLLSTDDWTQHARLPLDHCGPVGFDAAGTALVASGQFTGASVWPLKRDARLRVGPPRPLSTDAWPDFENGRLQPQYQGRQALFDSRGQLWLSDYRNGRVLRADTTESKPLRFAELVNTAQLAVSPDGQWIAAAAAFANIVRVWNAHNGSLVLEIPNCSSVDFSADGRLLAAHSTEQVHLYRVGTWALAGQINVPAVRGRLSSPIAFQPHGHLLAIAGPQQHVYLHHQETGRLAARLPHPGDGFFSSLAFSPTGDKLVVVRENSDVSIWDLRKLQDELREEGVTSFAELSPSTQHNSASVPPALGVDVELGSLPADQWYRCWSRLAEVEASKQSWPDAIHNLTSAIDNAPANDAGTMVKLFSQRAEYHRANSDDRSARADWEHCLSLDPANESACHGLIRLHLLGSPEVRDPRQVSALLALLEDRTVPTADHDLWRAMALVRLNKSDRKQLTALENPAVPAFWRIAAIYSRSSAQHALGNHAAANEQIAIAEQELLEAAASMAKIDRADIERLRAEVAATVARPAN